MNHARDDNIDDPPEMPLAFDEEGRPIAVSHPVYETPPDDERDAAEPISAKAETAERTDFEGKLSAFLSWLTEGNSVEAAGRKALLLAHLCHKTSAEDDAEFAKKIGVTKARVSQLRREIARGYGRLARCNSRRA